MRNLLFLCLTALCLVGIWQAIDLAQEPSGQEYAVTSAEGSQTDPWTHVLNVRQASHATGPAHDPGVIRIPGEDGRDSRDRFNQRLLRLVLQKTVPEFGPYKTAESRPINRLRAFVEVLDGRLDVTWSVSTALRESILLPVKRELSKGMHGYRIFLIRKGEQERFNQVRSLVDLRRLMAGGGHDWQPTEIWRANDLPIVTSDSYQTLFPMLVKQRFDYFPRALFEPWIELDEHPSLALEVEQTLLVHFNAPNYFFVHPSRVDLARRIAAGMDLAMNDGSFDALLEEFFEFAKMKSKLHMSQRRVFEISNPFTAAEPVVADRRFWFGPGELLKKFP